MSLTAAIADLKKYITAGGFEQEFTFTSPDGLTEAEVKGIESTHHTSFDTEGRAVNTKNCRITVIEADLIAEGVTTRNSRGDVNLKNWIVEYTAKNGISQVKKIDEQLPDDTLGTLTFWLIDYKK